MKESKHGDVWDDTARWRTVSKFKEATSPESLRAAYRLGRLRGYLQGKAEGTRRGFMVLFNMLCDARERSMSLRDSARLTSQYALAKRYGRTVNALDVALSIVQRVYTSAQVGAQVGIASPDAAPSEDSDEVIGGG